MLPKLALQILILLVLSEACSLAAPPYVPEPREVITAPTPHVRLPPGLLSGDAETSQVLRLPALAENPQPPPIQPAQPAESDQALPINLATALCLSNARPLVIAFAQASVQEAAALLQNANVLWLPDFNLGTDYYRHDGIDQSTDGTMIRDHKNALSVGGGATVSFGLTDAIFRPLAARQVLAARESDLQTARDGALLAVATAYFDVQQARGTLAGTLDALARADELVRKTAGLAKGLVAQIEVDRARALLFDLREQVAASRADWRITSARLTRVLRLNPGAVVVPMEPPHLQVSLISPGFRVADLVPVGLANRPELASRRALVQASFERVRQERLRPLLPNVIVEGRNGPGGAFNGSFFGGGPDGGPQLYAGRFDMDMGLVWTLQNLGAGNRSLVRARIAEEQQASIDFADVQDRVAQDVVQAHAQLEATAAQVDNAMTAVKEAIITYNGTLRGISETRGAGDLLQLVNRPQEAVAALQQLNRAYDLYFAAVNGYNRAQFQLYWALGYPARILVCDHPVGEVQPVDTSRPPGMAPVCPHVLSCPCP
ncbi:MAG: TolC family protein [Thermoguttaceae bacterium]|jgi:outer membrane protein TolC